MYDRQSFSNRPCRIHSNRLELLPLTRGLQTSVIERNVVVPSRALAAWSQCDRLTSRLLLGWLGVRLLVDGLDVLGRQQ
jgi:hypothetical protein